MATVSRTSDTTSARSPLLRSMRGPAGVRASVVLTLTATLWLALSVSQATLHLDGYGLAASLSRPFYLGLALLPAAAALNAYALRGRGELAVAQLLVLVAALWLMPLALEGTPRFRTSYSNFGDVDPLLRGAGLHPDLFVYHNWPLFPLGVAGLVTATGLSAMTVMSLFPAVIVTLYLVPLRALLRAAVPDATQDRARRPDLRWVAGAFFVLAFDWTDQDYFSPQAFAYLLFLCWMALMADAVVRRSGRLDTRRTVAAVGLFTAMVATHPLTPLVALGGLATLRMLRALRSTGLVVLCTLIFSAWQAYVAAPFFYGRASHVRSELFDGAHFLSLNLGGHLHGSPEHVVINDLRTGTTLLAFLMAAVAIAVVRRSERLRATTRFVAANLIGVAIVAPISVYGGEMLIRAFLFSLPALAVAVVAALEVPLMRTVVFGVLVVVTPLHVLTHYGNELYDRVSRTEVRGFDFIDDRLAPADIYGGYPAGAYRNTLRLESLGSVAPPTGTLPRATDYLDPQRQSWRRRNVPIYAVVSRGDQAAARIFYDRPGFTGDVRRILDRSAAFRRVYSNSDMVVYRWIRSSHR